MKGVSDWLLTELRVHLRGSYGPTSELRSFASHAISCQLRFSIATCEGGSGLGAKIQTLLDERSGSTLLSLPMTPGIKRVLILSSVIQNSSCQFWFYSKSGYWGLSSPVSFILTENLCFVEVVARSPRVGFECEHRFYSWARVCF